MLEQNHSKIANDVQSQSIETLLDMSPEDGPLGTPLPVTFFEDRRALKMQERTATLRDLEKLIRRSRAKCKDRMRQVKLGRFTGEKTAKGSFRHNAGHVAVTGI